MPAVETINVVTHTVNILDHHMTRVTVDNNVGYTHTATLRSARSHNVVGAL